MSYSPYLEFCKMYGIVPDFRPKPINILRQKICESDFLIADEKCTHRMVGLYFRMNTGVNPKLSLVCTRNEMSLAKKLAFESGKKIYYDSKLSALLFNKYYVGKEIIPEDYYYLVPLYADYFEHYSRTQYF